MLHVAGPAHHLRRRRCQISQRHRHPCLHLQHLHGRQVFVCKCLPIGRHRMGCIFKYLPSFPKRICVFSRSRCFNNSDGDFLIGEGKKASVGCWWGFQMFFAVISHKQDDSSIPLEARFSFQISLCLSLFVCLRLYSSPAG